MASARRIILSWFLVITYGVVTVAGTVVHGLTCSETSGSATVAASSHEHTHSHHHHHEHCHDHSSGSEKSPEPSEEQHRHQPHDSSDCFVCQHLAAGQEKTAIAKLSMAIEASEDAPLVSASIELLLPRSPRQSRAPPA